MKMSAVVKSNIRTRILQTQKKLLVQLVENFFIRTMGHCNDVNFENIDLKTWDRFACILNSKGPRKSASQWKSSFYYMKNRIRKSVEMIRQTDANVKENLSELDFKLYSMSPSGFFGALEEVQGLNAADIPYYSKFKYFFLQKNSVDF
ncbi:hypothetical protein Bhyg_12471 [Pseudolycoriella hygida]|uniref:Regulatory protein zeste n=1 Tax=Pseudolycoriella hygida TaxID=35572 RepID=A0A9Q0MYK1_9DIPT|nr:hypothetical protein Bhyg_12471 [Pseudolycoriella hygida]